MRKGWLVLLSLALVVALAVPASAEMKLNGFYRVKPTTGNFVGIAGNNQYTSPTSLTKANTSATISFTEMRNRLRFEIGDENVKGVTFFELDGNFGDMGGKTGRNQGFASNGDSINLETKNAYIWFKVPNTSLSFTVGLQSYTDEFAGLIFGYSDQAGVVANYKYEPVDFRLTWLKLRDDMNSIANPDSPPAGPFNSGWTGAGPGGKAADYYAVDAKFAPTKDAAATLHFGFINDRGKSGTTFISKPTEAGAGYDTLRSYYVGANGTVKLAPATLSAFFLYNFGQFEGTSVSDVKIAGYAARLRGDAAVGPGKLFLEGLFVSGDDDVTAGNTKYKSVVTGSDYAALTSYYASPDLFILFPNLEMINSATALVLNPNNSGRGLMLVAAGYNQKFTDKIIGKVGAGYLAADKKRATTNGKSMATEFNANVNYNISKGLDFGLYGAYALLGSFYDQTVSANDPDDLYILNGRLNYAF